MKKERDAVCPIDGCGKDLYLVVSVLIPITDAPGVGDLDDGINDDWEIVCENDHRLDSGSNEADGRGIALGYRRGQVLGGVR